MSYWSVFSSVDYLDEHCDYEVALKPQDALNAVAQAIASPGRVNCALGQDGSLHADTVNHTPAWVAAPVFPPLVIILALVFRKTRTAVITATETPTGSVLHLRGKLDTAAASRVRGLRIAS